MQTEMITIEKRTVTFDVNTKPPNYGKMKICTPSMKKTKQVNTWDDNINIIMKKSNSTYIDAVNAYMLCNKDVYCAITKILCGEI
jgi:hypothetical protein